MKKFLVLLLVLISVILIITFIEISFNDSKIFYGFVCTIILVYLTYLILTNYIFVEKYYPLQIFNEFDYDDEVKDHFKNIYKERKKKNRRIQISFNIILSFVLTNIIYFKFGWGMFYFVKEFYYLRKIAFIGIIYLVFHILYVISRKYWETNDQRTINVAYSKVIEEYLKNSFYSKETMYLILKSPLNSLQKEHYSLEIIRQYAVIKNDVKKALSIIDNISEKYYKIYLLLYLCNFLIRRKEVLQANIILSDVINMLDNKYKLNKYWIYCEITELFIKLKEPKKAQIFLEKTSESITKVNTFSTFVRASEEAMLRNLKNQIKDLENSRNKSNSNPV